MNEIKNISFKCMTKEENQTKEENKKSDPKKTLARKRRKCISLFPG